MKNIIVVAPHPDDETLGCGGTLLKHSKNGDRIHWLIVTKMTKEVGYTKKQISTRQSEIKKVSALYNFHTTTQLKFATTKLDRSDKNDLIKKISSVFSKIKPHTVYVPFLHDVHSDHSVVASAVDSCIKSFRAPYLKRVACYETLSETEQSVTAQKEFKPNLWVDISDFLENKIKILNVYKSEIKNHPFPRSESNVRALATFRGSMSNMIAAESFQILKEIN